MTGAKKQKKQNQPRQQQQQHAQPPAPMKKDAPLSKASKGNGQAKARERRNPDGSRTIFFEEYVQDINGSVAFSAQAFPVQPGISTLFAWLSSQAIAYQEYRVERLAFRFESDREATAPGKVMLAFQQDPTDDLPAGKQEMLENEFKAKCKTWEDTLLVVPKTILKNETMSNKRFIRAGNLAANLDLKTYDIGQLIVASQGQADGTDVGELYVQYAITLLTPVINSAIYAYAATALSVATTGVSKTSTFGSAATFSGGLNVTATGNVLTFQRVGKYLCLVNTTGVGLSTSYVPTLTPSSGATAGVATGVSNAAANAGTNALWYFTATITARGQTITLDQSAEAATSVSQNIVILTAYSTGM